MAEKSMNGKFRVCELFVLTLVLGTMAAGCNNKPNYANAIPGGYLGTYGGASEAFQFGTDGNFIQKLYVNGICEYTNRGTWAVEKKPATFDPTFHIVLKPFICSFDTGTGKLTLPPTGYALYYADWDEHAKRIEFNLDAGYFAIKTNTIP